MTNSRALACFISRPMSGVSYAEDCQLILDIKKAAKEAGMYHFRVMNSWSGPQVPLRIMNPRLYRLGRAISQMAEADIIILVKDSWKTAKGCAIERRVTEQYFDSYEAYWTVYVYDPTNKVLTDVTNGLKAAHMGIKVN